MSGVSRIPSPKITGKAARQVAATILALIGILGSVQLLRDHSISELTFVSLCAGCSIVGLFIAFIDRIKLLSLRELKITLRKIENSKREIEEIAYHTVRLIVLSRNGVLTFDGTPEETMREASINLLNAAGVPSSDSLYQQILDTNDTDSPQAEQVVRGNAANV